LDGVAFVSPDPIFVPCAAVAGRPGSGGSVEAGAADFAGSAGPGVTIDGLAAGADAEDASGVGETSVAGAVAADVAGEGDVSAGLGGSTTATVCLPSPLSIR
ncbi:MAG TPA: hypothetical protein VF014_05150, partial [Casimicrobiaceae bacterium]|nr:hypothetical protein [Casimicrobiaceae bacterium]